MTNRNTYIDETTSLQDDLTMTPKDRTLLALLRENARTPAAELARRLGVSRTTVQSRIERLERDGVIAGYTVRVATAREASEIRAHVLVVVGPKATAGVIAALKAMPAVRRLHSVSGAYDLVAELAAESVAEMDAVLDAIGELEGVERTTSMVVLSTKIDR